MNEPIQNSNYKWIILVIAGLTIFTPSYVQYQLAPLAPQLFETLKLSTSQFAGIFSAPMIPAIFFSLIAGLLADRFGIKQVIAVGLVISAAGACARIVSGSYITLYLSMILTGFGGAFLNANSAKVLGGWFPLEKLGSMMGILLAGSTLGMTAGMATTAMLPGILTAYIAGAVLMVSAAGLWLLFMKNPAKNETAPSLSIPITDCLKVVVKSRGVWMVGFSLMAILGSNITISSFLPTALVQRGIPAVNAGAYGAAITIGNLIGCIGSPILSIKVGKNRPLLVIFAVISAAGAAFSWKAPQGFLLAVSLCITGISIGGLMPILMSVPIQLPEIGPAFAGTAGGFVSTLQLIGAVAIPSFIAAPLAGNNMSILFIIAGISMLLVSFLSFGIPEVIQNRKNQLQEN